jgi:phospholipase/carboxylesterase
LVVRENVGPVHEYLFVPATETGSAPLVLLHGSDGRETDLLPLAKRLSPSAAKISIRGAVATSDGYAFFRRLADRRIDEQDLASRVSPLCQLIETALFEHGLRQHPLAVGFSNGAIMAAAALQTRPELFSGAILFRPLSPFSVAPKRALQALPVLVLDGAHDERRTPGDGQVLGDTLRRAGADVQHHVLPTGHLIGELDEQIAGQWMKRAGTAKNQAGEA